MSDPKEDSNFDFDNMGGDADPFASDGDNSEGGADPFNFTEDAPTAPQPQPAVPPPPPGPAKPKSSARSSASRSKASASSNPSAGLAADMPVQVVAVLGKKTITVGDLVGLKKGEVVELNRFPNEAVDLVANGKLMAKGELVEIDGKLGVRIIKIFE